MKTATKRTLGIAAAVAIAIGSATVVFAHGGGMGSGGGSGGMGSGMMGGGMMGGRGMMNGQGMTGGHGMMGFMGEGAEAVESRLATAHDKLGITPAQEPAWQGFVTAARGQASYMEAQHSAGPAMGSSQTHSARMQVGSQLMTQLNGAETKLYEVLTPEQRLQADVLFGHHFTR